MKRRPFDNLSRQAPSGPLAAFMAGLLIGLLAGLVSGVLLSPLAYL